MAISLLFAGFLFNRVIQNIGVFFACVYIVSNDKWYKVLSKDWYILSFAFLAIIVFIFDLFHSPSEILRSSFFLKLSLVVYPLFINIWSPQKKEIIAIFYALMIIISVNIIYGFYYYATDMHDILEGYKKAKVLPTLALNDHIRLSWLTGLSLWGALYILNKESRPTLKITVYLYIITAVIYLHVLSAKTGLLVLYSSVIIYCLYLFLDKQYLKVVTAIIALSIIPFIAYKTIPSLQNRMAFVVWDVTEYLSGNRQIGLSDGSRIASLKAGWELANENWLFGTGPIILKSKTFDWYKKNEPKLSEKDNIMPSSQFLILFASCGIIGLLIFIFHLIIPLLTTVVWKDGIFISIYISSIGTFIFETHLEGQYAIFVYSFFIYLFFYTAQKAVNNIKVIDHH